MLRVNNLVSFGGKSGGGASGSTTTWNPSDKSAGITLSNGNLTASYSAHTNNVRATTGKQTGKWYWEVTVTAIAASCAVNTGIWPASRAIGTYIYTTTGVVRFWSGGPALAVNDVIGYAFDADGGSCAVYKNNTLYGTASVTIGGENWHPVIGDDNASGTFTCVANFGASAFTYTPPSGYIALP